MLDILVQKQQKVKGGAFPTLELSRIKREHVVPTLKDLAQKLNIQGLDYEYMSSHLMGSVGKQSDSGDIDISVDQKQFPKKILTIIAQKVQSILGKAYATTHLIKGGQVNIAWPIFGEESKFIQVDFLYGPDDWLKFTHYSPGTDLSPFKGVWMSTLMGVLAKFAVNYRERNANGVEVARVSLNYDLERGLFRKHSIIMRDPEHMSTVEPEVWETRLGTLMDRGIIPRGPIPRFSRIGYIDDPLEVVRILFGSHLYLKDVDTFEKMWDRTRRSYPKELPEIKERLIEALSRNGLKNRMTPDEIREMLDTLG
jgi:hypothetical protein